MYMAKNGAAIIADVMVPASEVKALKTLVEIGRPATVPEIARAMHDKMSDASLYKLLSRLDEQRRLVSRQVAFVDVQGTALRRILWSATQAAMNDFAETKETNDPRSETTRIPVGAAG